MKKTGVLLATLGGRAAERLASAFPVSDSCSLQTHTSQLPSSVLTLMAQPLGSRAVSDEPDSPPTVENRTTTDAFLPGFMMSAQQMSSAPAVVSQVPMAPAPLAWTTRSGIRSRLCA